jgi:hypothetical protein
MRTSAVAYPADVPRARSRITRNSRCGDHRGLAWQFTRDPLSAPCGSTDKYDRSAAGEPGTGKEVIACAIHELRPAADTNLVKVNCAAMRAGLLETELFGQERGAFTGAINSRVGRFALADHGTLFLDEVGDMPLELQLKCCAYCRSASAKRSAASRTSRDCPCAQG